MPKSLAVICWKNWVWDIIHKITVLISHKMARSPSVTFLIKYCNETPRKNKHEDVHSQRDERKRGQFQLSCFQSRPLLVRCHDKAQREDRQEERHNHHCDPKLIFYGSLVRPARSAER